MFYLLICVSALWCHVHGYHYEYYPTPFYTPTAPASGHFGSGPQTGSSQTQRHKYEWNKPSGNTTKTTTPPTTTTMTTTTHRRTTRTSQTGPDRSNLRAQAQPAPGTMSQPVPTLGKLFTTSLQWHVGIYSKRFTPYMQVCGGSLVRADVVLSAAHCFWDDDVGALRAGLFAVAAGKLLRPWMTEGEAYTQHSDIKEIMIPPRFQGVKTSFQDDIAIIFLSRPLEYAPGVKPICLSFDRETEQRHLKSGNLGKIAGWGLTMPNGPPSQRLNYLELPYVDIKDCIRTAVPSFLKYITSDKICAGDQSTGRALCRGDSGGGLAYNSGDVPYLVGIASTAPRDDNQCNAYAVATFTYPRAHSAFLLEHAPGIDEGCEGLYSNATDVQNETMGVTQSPIIKDETTQQLGVDLPAAIDRTFNIKEPVTDQKMVTMSVESGERSVVRVPVQGARTLVCNCYCKN